ncbi:hypothetical protein [Paenibacillus xylaniclasticus]|uniref:hypothetical protein n=1 Tax=Paenibacillus xylaniclasticus TaxID=588083 RepID=UPI000FDBE5CA|nr:MULTISPECIES: hypothetical protein [Paenibacillus]
MLKTPGAYIGLQRYADSLENARAGSLFPSSNLIELSEYFCYTWDGVVMSSMKIALYMERGIGRLLRCSCIKEACRFN